MKTRSLAALLVVLLAGTAAAQSLSGRGTAVIDGLVGNDEWKGSATAANALVALVLLARMRRVA